MNVYTPNNMYKKLIILIKQTSILLFPMKHLQ